MSAQCVRGYASAIAAMLLMAATGIAASSVPADAATRVVKISADSRVGVRRQII
jgi:hypothetical protein